MKEKKHYRVTFRQKINERFALNIYLHSTEEDFDNVVGKIVDLILDNSDYNYATIQKVEL